MPLKEVRESKNELVRYFLTILRDERTEPKTFREYLKKLGFALALEMSDVINREEIRVRTPIAEAKGIAPKDKVAIVAILRAGLPMAEGVLYALDRSSLGLMAAKRIEDGEIRVEIYYENVPEADLIVIVDPMIATGTTLSESVKRVAHKAKRIAIIGAIAAPEGIEKLKREFEGLDVPVYMIVASIDEGLNDRAFIVPGLGDAGDRSFGTI